MKSEAIKEKLIYYNSLKTNIWAALIILGGGLSNLMLNMDSKVKLLLFISGCLWGIVLITVLSTSIFKIRFYTNKLNEGE